ncbi:MAG TPA: thiamine phosphate synthase [Holophaga sp.]|jgi:thiamine monophosphate synthase|nr:thiamine phosphate synthase [Holophaga sp.]
MYILGITPGEGFEPTRWKRVLASGIDAITIREKQLGTRAQMDCVRWVQDQAPDLTIWVAGRLDVALACGCGLHVPELYPEVPTGLAPLSRPLHDAAQFGERLGADQLIVSPIFPVPGKGPAWGPARLRNALGAWPESGCRILALGGLTPFNTAQVQHPRLAGVALMRSLWKGADPARVVDLMRATWNGGPGRPL